MSKQRFRLPGSSRPTTKAIAAVDPHERLTVTIYLRRDPGAGRPPAVRELGRIAPHARSYLRPEQAVAVFGAAQADFDTVCCASGDNGSGDEPNTTSDHVDFPASSPWVLGCGGTRLEADSATLAISSEAVWNDLSSGEGASGGGVSRLFGVPRSCFTWGTCSPTP